MILSQPAMCNEFIAYFHVYARYMIRRYGRAIDGNPENDEMFPKYGPRLMTGNGYVAHAKWGRMSFWQMTYGAFGYLVSQFQTKGGAICAQCSIGDGVSCMRNGKSKWAFFNSNWRSDVRDASLRSGGCMSTRNGRRKESGRFLKLKFGAPMRPRIGPTGGVCGKACGGSGVSNS